MREVKFFWHRLTGLAYKTWARIILTLQWLGAWDDSGFKLLVVVAPDIVVVEEIETRTATYSTSTVSTKGARQMALIPASTTSTHPSTLTSEDIHACVAPSMCLVTCLWARRFDGDQPCCGVEWSWSGMDWTTQVEAGSALLCFTCSWNESINQ